MGSSQQSACFFRLLGRRRMSGSGAMVGRGGGGGVGAGWTILIPGCPQWSWRQRERALVLLASYVLSIGVGLFAWGTPVGLVLMAFAYGTHAASVADVIRQ